MSSFLIYNMETLEFVCHFVYKSQFFKYLLSLCDALICKIIYANLITVNI
jgi:hypothetical protein